MKRKPPLLTITLIILTVLLGIASGPVSSAIELPAALKPFALPLLLILAVVLSLIAVGQYFLQEKPESPGMPLSRQNRQRLLARVRAFWITGVLEQSLHGVALLALGLREQPDMVTNPWRLVLQQTAQPEHPLPAGTRITQVYDTALGELLILGEPGAGKTTLLLELARDLLSRAEADESLPMPLVFHLSSWAVKRQPLADWLVEEMNTKYQVPHKLGQAWMQADQVLPLLDGLDEVVLTHRPACVEAINTFRQKHGLVPVVVCSRSAEYLDLKQQVLLRSTVIVQPLTERQIDEYLASAGEQMEAVRVALRDDPGLQELTTTPLMLSMLTLAYRGRPDKDRFTAGTLEARRRQLFEDYVQRMLQRRGTQTRYTVQETISWLTWLARQLLQHNQTEFYLEQMRADWLPDTRSRLGYGVAVGLVSGLLVGLISGLLGGLLVGLVSGLLVGLFVGLFGGLLFGLVFGVFGPRNEIKPAEVIAWSWQSIQRGLVFGLLSRLLVWLVFGLFVGLISGLLGGLSSERMDKQHLVTPNQGIWRSVRNGALYGLLSGLLSGLVSGLLFGLFVGLFGGLVGGLVVGLDFGGEACIQHFALRWVLWRAGSLPWNYPRFLDYSAERILLRKVGGGYIFVHRLLLEYFAAQRGTSIPTEGVKYVQDAPSAP